MITNRLPLHSSMTSTNDHRMTLEIMIVVIVPIHHILKTTIIVPIHHTLKTTDTMLWPLPTEEVTMNLFMIHVPPEIPEIP